MTSLRKSQSSASMYKEDNDSDLAFLDSEDEIDATVPELIGENQLIVDKILGRKFLPNEQNDSDEWYFIKWKGRSYLHASWEKKEDVEAVDISAKQKIKRFLQTATNPAILGIPKETTVTPIGVEEEEGTGVNADEEEIDYYNPEMVEVQRIISCDTVDTSHAKAKSPDALLKTKSRKRKAGDSASDDGADEENEVRYLVKWRGLSYDECTWERWEELKSWYREVWLFWYLQRPPRNLAPANSSPAIQEYKKMDVSPDFGETKIPVLQEEEEGRGGLKLRDYQLEGVNWLLWNWWHKRSCVLADEMGLGKTIQTICFLHQLRYMPTTNINGPFLIIAPLSLVDQWQSEIATWSPDMNTVLLHGNVLARSNIVNNEFYYQEPFISKADASTLKKSSTCKFHILLTTFEVAVKEIKTLLRIPWKVMIIDEAHRLKNPTARLFTMLSSINAEHCVLLTGTPLQNKTEELWALLNFAEGKRFADLGDFVSKFGDLKDAQQVAALHEVLKPYLLRRIKEDVEKSLPPKEETIVEVALTSVQKRFYRAIFEKNTVYLYRGLKASNQPSLMNVMMELRKCCNHPYLVRGVEERILGELPPEDVMKETVLYQKLIESSGKLVLLDKLLPKLQSQGHKVLIFSQMVKVLNILEDFLKFRGYLYERLDGTSRAADRKEAVDRFCKPSMNRFVMLLSTKAGGLGLNLVAADTVIIYDSDWNPQNDLQAQARAHRIGQTKAVMVYRLLTRKTYEMQMFHQASLKLGLDRAVLAHARIEQEEQKAKKKSKSAGDKLSMGAKEIDELLKRGAYDVFREDDTEQKEFVEADIDSILQRRSHKIVYDNALGNVTSSLGNFSKASFVSADEKEDVDINDPDFWKKAVGLKEETKSILDDPEAYEELPQQRVRKQTKAWNGVASVDEDQLKELLKPLKAEKSGDKKPVPKEAIVKEKQDREEARKLKMMEEVRIKGDPKNWGSHTRDRLLRCLNLYGFGRWERIKVETGKGMMDTKELEGFSRAYVLQCGLCASSQEPSKHDSAFVKETIEAAKRLQAMVLAGEKELDIPPSLQEDRFLSKLRSGQAKKILNKLDALAKLVNLVRLSVEEAYRRRELEFDDNMDIDTAASILTAEDVATCLPLGDYRPMWTRTCIWWDLQCDRHLVVGIFKHGFGRYDLIKEDEDLVFKGIIAKAIGENQDTSMKPSEGDGAIMDIELGMDLNEEKEDGDLDMDFDGGGATKGEANGTTHGGWPDPRHLNRLAAWLVTADEAKLSKDEFVERQKREKRPKALSDLSTKKEKKDEKETTDFLLNISEGSEFTAQHSLLIRSMAEQVDLDAITMVHRSAIQGLGKCEYILSIPISYDAILPPASNSANKQVETGLPNSAERAVSGNDGNEMDVVQEEAAGQERKEDDADNIHVAPDSSQRSRIEENNCPGSSEVVPPPIPIAPSSNVINEFEAIRLSATLILRGAPLEDVQGSQSDTVYSWRRVQEFSQVRLTEDQLMTFYFKIWLPFCEQISLKKNLSYSPNKYLVPNPTVSVSEHHYAARGLCQIFLIRQQLLFAVSFLVKHCHEALVEYFRSPAGRNVDQMPVWWCPWIHDMGLLLGMVKYGFLSVGNLIEDDDLPFNRRYLQVFITQAFFLSKNRSEAMARYEIHSRREADKFIRASLLQFPDVKDMEIRVLRIVDDLTKNLPPEHVNKINLAPNYKAILVQHTGGLEVDKKGGDSAKNKVDARARSNKPPAVSMRAYVSHSRKRRKSYLITNHPECFGNTADGVEESNEG